MDNGSKVLLGAFGLAAAFGLGAMIYLTVKKNSKTNGGETAGGGTNTGGTNTGFAGAGSKFDPGKAGFIGSTNVGASGNKSPNSHITNPVALQKKRNAWNQHLADLKAKGMSY